MNKKDGFKRFKEIQEEQFKLHTAKNHDYSAGDYFGNLKASKEFGIDPMLGIIVRLIDKLSRLSSFVQQGVLEVKDEKIEDTLNDISVYAVIARILYEHNR